MNLSKLGLIAFIAYVLQVNMVKGAPIIDSPHLNDLIKSKNSKAAARNYFMNLFNFIVSFTRTRIPSSIRRGCLEHHRLCQTKPRNFLLLRNQQDTTAHSAHRLFIG